VGRLHQRWPAGRPVDYDLIIDSDCPQDPRTVIRAAISSNTADTLTVSASDLAHAITEGRAASLSSLVGGRPDHRPRPALVV
jgi:hypothetical protein